MKTCSLLLGILFASLSPLAGQVTVEVVLNQDQFLSGEALPAGVRIINRSGQTLTLGSDSSWLKLLVESRDGVSVNRRSDVPILGEFTVFNAERATRWVQLTPHFDLATPGRYQVTATVFIPEWNREFTSAPAEFNILVGTKMWEREVGIPMPPGLSNAAPELRGYTLHQANYLKKDLVLYVRVSDATGRLNKVFPVGPLLSFSHPDPQLDRSSRLHLLYQSGPHSYSYFVVDTNGELLVRQRYDLTSRPRLQMDDTGNISVIGGARRPTPTDLPAPNLPMTNVEPLSR
jgi:hypothetical protein